MATKRTQGEASGSKSKKLKPNQSLMTGFLKKQPAPDTAASASSSSTTTTPLADLESKGKPDDHASDGQVSATNKKLAGMTTPDFATTTGLAPASGSEDAGTASRSSDPAVTSAIGLVDEDEDMFLDNLSDSAMLESEAAAMGVPQSTPVVTADAAVDSSVNASSSLTLRAFLLFVVGFCLEWVRKNMEDATEYLGDLTAEIVLANVTIAPDLERYLDDCFANGVAPNIQEVMRKCWPKEYAKYKQGGYLCLLDRGSQTLHVYVGMCFRLTKLGMLGRILEHLDEKLRIREAKKYLYRLWQQWRKDESMSAPKADFGILFTVRQRFIGSYGALGPLCLEVAFQTLFGTPNGGSPVSMPPSFLNLFASYANVSPSTPANKLAQMAISKATSRNINGTTQNFPMTELDAYKDVNRKLISRRLADGPVMVRMTLRKNGKQQMLAFQTGQKCFWLDKSQEDDMYARGFSIETPWVELSITLCDSDEVHPENFAQVDKHPLYEDAHRILMTLAWTSESGPQTLNVKQGDRNLRVYRAALSMSYLEYSLGILPPLNGGDYPPGRINIESGKIGEQMKQFDSVIEPSIEGSLFLDPLAQYHCGGCWATFSGLTGLKYHLGVPAQKCHDPAAIARCRAKMNVSSDEEVLEMIPTLKLKQAAQAAKTNRENSRKWHCKGPGCIFKGQKTGLASHLGVSNDHMKGKGKQSCRDACDVHVHTDLAKQKDILYY
ncbi:hypothetical protein PRZ48_011153 [Zasmidium cellare]|uniref:C2H2-type domain-containing protein n=1 Tax=Zasmidium cellare TaxID=395010 RepID=A0ABR0EBH0_ZASCE|nr:hypothetical protein PRZ48_011153 [Zasmidium cellare]